MSVFAVDGYTFMMDGIEDAPAKGGCQAVEVITDAGVNATVQASVTGIRASVTGISRDCDNMDRLNVPALEKQWLISPPPSPPIGWEPVKEDPPVINYNLVEVLMGLDPRACRELHPAAGVAPAISVQLVDSEVCLSFSFYVISILYRVLNADQHGLPMVERGRARI